MYNITASMTKSAGSIVCGLIMMFIGSSASALLIDGMDGPFQSSGTTEVGAPISNVKGNSGTPIPNVLGGQRDTLLEQTAGNFMQTNFEINFDPGGTSTASPPPTSYYSHSNDSGVNGTMLFQYDGDDEATTPPDGGAISLNKTGLGGVDVTDGGLSTRFEFAVVSNDSANMMFTLTVYDMDMDEATVSTTIPTIGSNVQVQFSALETDNAAIDLDNVGAIEIEIATTDTAWDLTLDGIQTTGEPPEPVPTMTEWGIITLMLGLAGAAFIRVRRMNLAGATSIA